MGKKCDRMRHVTACIGVFFAIIAGSFYLVLRGMRSNVLLNLAEYRELHREWDTMPFNSMLTVPAS